jgi:chromosome segregation ATPase
MQSIILKNFKSYENQTIASLNSRINIVVGANGQGKSNFFKGTIYPIQPSHFSSLIDSP